MSEPESVLSRSLRALWLLTASSLRRMLREDLVVRSMVWPGLVTAATLSVTLSVAALVRPGRDLAVPPDLDPELVAAFEAADFDVEVRDDPATWVHAGGASLGTDGRTLWLYGTPSAALEVESMLRSRVSAPWRPVILTPPSADSELARGDVVCGVLALLFVLYGLVFGLGGVARDRDDGTLEIELSLPVPRWVGGLARWIASTLILAAFYAASAVMLAAILPTPHLDAAVRNGIAACGGGVAIGLAVVGSAGIKQGFSGPFALGMTSATGLALSGATLGLTWLPIGSLFAGGDGWGACAVALGSGGLCAALYGWRTGVA
ncbi:MAG: ABC transporter permease subunit [Myxococcota bacterium]